MNVFIIVYLSGFTRSYVEFEAERAQDAVDFFRSRCSFPIIYCLSPTDEEWE